MSTKVNYPKIEGIYKHYKGGEYKVITLATHSENGEPLVIYKSLLFGNIYARPLSVWNEPAEGRSGNITRFSLVS